MSFLDRIKAANRRDMRRYRPFLVDNQRVGFVNREFVERLRHWPDVFAISEQTLSLSPSLDAADVASRSAAVDQVVRELRGQGVFGPHWWDEPFAVNTAFHQPPLLLLERAALQHFGVCGYGVHVNGFVRDGEQLKLWVARRALDKPTAPGKLDQIVAGGQPAGLSLKENVIKECEEEAAIGRELAKQALPTGALSYCLETRYGLRPDVVYTFDLELPSDFVPANNDGEVEAFYCWPVEQVMTIVRDSDDFKFNCALVIIDFLIRRGVIEPEHPEYLELISGLRQREPLLATFT